MDGTPSLSGVDDEDLDEYDDSCYEDTLDEDSEDEESKGRKSSFFFWVDLKIPKCPFEINWPLEYEQIR